jgi:hypothetical protein
MVEWLGDGMMLLTPEEDEIFERQLAAAATADRWKWDDDVRYQNRPRGGERCGKCALFVRGLPGELGGYCRKVHALRGPTGMIHWFGWCRKYMPS